MCPILSTLLLRHHGLIPYVYLWGLSILSVKGERYSRQGEKKWAKTPGVERSIDFLEKHETTSMNEVELLVSGKEVCIWDTIQLEWRV